MTILSILKYAFLATSMLSTSSMAAVKKSTTSFLTECPNTLPAHCRAEFAKENLNKYMCIREHQADTGLLHSAGIVQLSEDAAETGKQIGMVYFSNQLRKWSDNTLDGDVVGKQHGHCVEVSKTSKLACYFHFNVQDKGRLTAEAEFDLNNFPNAVLVITGGTGDFSGVKGHGCTFADVPFNSSTFTYHFQYQ